MVSGGFQGGWSLTGRIYSGVPTVARLGIASVLLPFEMEVPRVALAIPVMFTVGAYDNAARRRYLDLNGKREALF